MQKLASNVKYSFKKSREAEEEFFDAVVQRLSILEEKVTELTLVNTHQNKLIEDLQTSLRNKSMMESVVSSKTIQDIEEVHVAPEDKLESASEKTEKKLLKKNLHQNIFLMLSWLDVTLRELLESKDAISEQIKNATDTHHELSTMNEYVHACLDSWKIQEKALKYQLSRQTRDNFPADWMFPGLPTKDLREAGHITTQKLWMLYLHTRDLLSRNKFEIESQGVGLTNSQQTCSYWLPCELVPAPQSAFISFSDACEVVLVHLEEWLEGATLNDIHQRNGIYSSDLRSTIENVGNRIEEDLKKVRQNILKLERANVKTNSDITEIQNNEASIEKFAAVSKEKSIMHLDIDENQVNISKLAHAVHIIQKQLVKKESQVSKDFSSKEDSVNDTSNTKSDILSIKGHTRHMVSRRSTPKMTSMKRPKSALVRYNTDSQKNKGFIEWKSGDEEKFIKSSHNRCKTATSLKQHQYDLSETLKKKSIQRQDCRYSRKEKKQNDSFQSQILKDGPTTISKEVHLNEPSGSSHILFETPPIFKTRTKLSRRVHAPSISHNTAQLKPHSKQQSKAQMLLKLPDKVNAPSMSNDTEQVKPHSKQQAIAQTVLKPYISVSNINTNVDIKNSENQTKHVATSKRPKLSSGIIKRQIRKKDTLKNTNTKVKVTIRNRGEHNSLKVFGQKSKLPKVKKRLNNMSNIAEKEKSSNFQGTNTKRKPISMNPKYSKVVDSFNSKIKIIETSIGK